MILWEDGWLDISLQGRSCRQPVTVSCECSEQTHLWLLAGTGHLQCWENAASLLKAKAVQLKTMLRCPKSGTLQDFCLFVWMFVFVLVVNVTVAFSMYTLTMLIIVSLPSLYSTPNCNFWPFSSTSAFKGVLSKRWQHQPRKGAPDNDISAA